MPNIAKNLVRRVKKPVMNICMMGPKAVGKTTILTAVFNESQNSILQTSLKLTAKGDTGDALDQRLKMLRSTFANKSDIVDNTNMVVSSGISATAYESRFDFELGHIGQDPIIDILIRDFPGERIVNEQRDGVVNFIKESQCVFIAIDTPHLMEADGRFNDIKNKPKEITNLFRRALNEQNSEKLVLLIPLKCEKYAHNGNMNLVLERVQESYSDLISLLSQKENICCCVSPILTLGDVEFDSFSFDEIGNIQIADDGCPKDVKYKFVCGAGENEPEYTPSFCFQPLYAMLSFVAAQYKRGKTKLNLIDRLRNFLWELFNSDQQLFDDILKMEKNRIADNTKLGYKIICGGNLFHYNH